MLAAVLMEKGSKCPSCGLSEREFLEDPTAYVAMAITCPWCAMRDRARSGGDTKSDVPGSTVKLVSQGTAKRISETPAKRPDSPRERRRKR